MLGGEGVKLVKGIKSYKPPVIKRTSHRDVIYSIRNTVSSIVITLHGDRWLLDLSGDHFIMYVNVKSLHCTFETNI